MSTKKTVPTKSIGDEPVDVDVRLMRNDERMDDAEYRAGKVDALLVAHERHLAAINGTIHNTGEALRDVTVSLAKLDATVTTFMWIVGSVAVPLVAAILMKYFG